MFFNYLDAEFMQLCIVSRQPRRLICSVLFYVQTFFQSLLFLSNFAEQSLENWFGLVYLHLHLIKPVGLFRC